MASVGFSCIFVYKLLSRCAADDFQPDGDSGLQKPEACSSALLYVSMFLMLRNKIQNPQQKREVDFITHLLAGSTNDDVCSRTRDAQAACTILKVVGKPWQLDGELTCRS